MPKKTTEEPVFKTWRSIDPLPGWSAGSPRRRKVKPLTKAQARAAEKDAIIAALGTTPQPAEAIARETGLPLVNVAARLRELVGRGIVIATREGFRR